jgi:hypothetical protein
MRALIALASALQGLWVPACGILVTVAAVAAGTWHVAVRGFGSSKRRRRMLAPLTAVLEGEEAAGELAAVVHVFDAVLML